MSIIRDLTEYLSKKKERFLELEESTLNIGGRISDYNSKRDEKIYQLEKKHLQNEVDGYISAALDSLKHKQWDGAKYEMGELEKIPRELIDKYGLEIPEKKISSINKAAHELERRYDQDKVNALIREADGAARRNLHKTDLPRPYSALYAAMDAEKLAAKYRKEGYNVDLPHGAVSRIKAIAHEQLKRNDHGPDLREVLGYDKDKYELPENLLELKRKVLNKD